jgi:hypothetical protein
MKILRFTTDTDLPVIIDGLIDFKLCPIEHWKNEPGDKGKSQTSWKIQRNAGTLHFRENGGKNLKFSFQISLANVFFHSIHIGATSAQWRVRTHSRLR